MQATVRMASVVSSTVASDPGATHRVSLGKLSRNAPMDQNPMTTSTSTPPGLARRNLRSPLARILLLGFILLMMMSLNTDVMTSYARDPFKSVQHIVALAIAGFAVYGAYASFIEQRPSPNWPCQAWDGSSASAS